MSICIYIWHVYVFKGKSECNLIGLAESDPTGHEPVGRVQSRMEISMETQEAATALCCLTGTPGASQTIPCVPWIRTLQGVVGVRGAHAPSLQECLHIPHIYELLNASTE